MRRVPGEDLGPGVRRHSGQELWIWNLNFESLGAERYLKMKERRTLRDSPARRHGIGRRIASRIPLGLSRSQTKKTFNRNPALHVKTCFATCWWPCNDSDAFNTIRNPWITFLFLNVQNYVVRHFLISGSLEPPGSSRDNGIHRLKYWLLVNFHLLFILVHVRSLYFQSSWFGNRIGFHDPVQL